MPNFDSFTAGSRNRARKLAALMAVGAEREKPWRDDELAAIFRHQMAAPMLVDLVSFDAAQAPKSGTSGGAGGMLLRSFNDFFRHPSPPAKLVELVKAFAKANMDHPGSGLPAEIAGVLYYASIAIALVRLNLRITRLPDFELRRGLNWATEQLWLDQITSDLLTQALDKLPEHPEAPSHE